MQTVSFYESFSSLNSKCKFWTNVKRLSAHNNKVFRLLQRQIARRLKIERSGKYLISLFLTSSPFLFCFYSSFIFWGSWNTLLWLPQISCTLMYIIVRGNHNNNITAFAKSNELYHGYDFKCVHSTTVNIYQCKIMQHLQHVNVMLITSKQISYLQRQTETSR